MNSSELKTTFHNHSRRQRPSLEPQQVNSDTWYYEYRRTLEFHQDVRDEQSGDFLRHIRFVVPMSRLIKSIRRCYDFKRAAERERSSR